MRHRGAALVLAWGVACGPRVPPPPPFSSTGGVLAPPSQARAAVARGWHALAAGDPVAAERAASRAQRLDPGAPGPLRLAAAVADAVGEPEEAGRLLAEALARAPGCVPCLADVAVRTRADGDAALALAAGAHPGPVIDAGPWPPGPRARAAWRERVDLDGRERAHRGRALLAAGEVRAALVDLRAAAETGVADAETLRALRDAGDAAAALRAAGRAADRRGGDARAQQLWFALAHAHGAPAEARAAAAALGALPASRLGGDARGSAAASLREGRPPPGLPAGAAWTLLAEDPGPRGAVALEALGGPTDPAGLSSWLRAAAAVGVPTLAEEQAALATGDPAWVEVVARWRIARGDADGAAAVIDSGLLDDAGVPPVWWPGALDAAGLAGAAEAARGRFASAEARAALLVAEAHPDAWRAVEAAGGGAASLRPAALALAGRPCDAVSAFVTLRSQSRAPVPGAGAVGYAGAIAGCWTAESLPALRDAQAATPSDGRLAHALGRVLADLGDPRAAALLAQARRALPADPALRADLARLPRDLEDRP